ncbi:hypothetical protein BCR34DRAFT_605026 [Clohesyomyces aquaticus]|uniref:Uncharacterized protein n=1 Tax=Clohesyomyces aquaticus TaxID=1231657 RepID=A0A1Y1Z161_9PLEO|nr:hypothetical protein BCR34DRAFT_605026 [Clohesyomyces aquaticus]
MESFNAHYRPNRTQPLRPNVFETTSPPRISTDPSSSSSSKRSHLRGLHHHPHRHHHHHHHHHSRHTKDAVQSAVQLHPPTSFGDLLKQASRSSHHSPAHSIPESRPVITVRPDVNPDPQTSVRPADVTKERERVKAGADELRSSLQSLSDQSLKTSRRLDDTYYSVLEKVSVLRQTIGSLQELSGLTKELHENFQADTEELVEDVKSQLEGLDNFDSQQRQVEMLEERIQAGRTKAVALNERLTDARKRVDARAKLEAEWEVQTSRRLRMLWGILGSIAVLVVTLILFQQLRPMHPGNTKMAPDFRSRSDLVDSSLPKHAKEALINTSPAKSIPRVSSPFYKPVSPSDDDPRLHVFDEL